MATTLEAIPQNCSLPVHHPDVQAFLAAPIASRARVYGWICLVGNEGRMFTADDEPLVMALAGQVGRIYELEYQIASVTRRSRRCGTSGIERNATLTRREVILLALDLDGRITLINRNGCDLIGWTEHELLGQDWIETCVPVRLRAAVRKTFDGLLGGDFSIVENAVLTRSGEERLIEWRNTVLRDDGGAVIGTLSSGTDVTERQQAVEALRVADERMRFALESAVVGIWDMDSRTGVLRWSEILEAQYGLQPGTFGGTFEAFIERVHPDDRASVLETIARAMKSGADFAVQHRALRPDGTVRWLSGAGRYPARRTTASRCAASGSPWT